MKNSKTFLLFVAGTLPFITLVVSGFSIYLINRNEIVFKLTDIIFPLTALFLIILSIVYLILWSLRRFTTLSGALTGILVGLSMAVWAQSQLLVWNFGHFNGQVIDWDKWKINMYIDCIVWVLIIGGCLFGFIKKKQKVKSALVIGVYILGMASVVMSFLKAPDKIESSINESEYKDIFTFHPKKNVLVILLDDFQSDYFEYIANNYPNEIGELDGFTFYRNTISRYPTTMASLPSIMTGSLYKNDKPYYEYITESHDKFNIIQAYKNVSYNTSFVGQLEGVYPDIISMDKLVYTMTHSNFYPLLEYLDYGTFRALPTFLKPAIFNNGNWFLTFFFRSKYPPQHHGTDIQFLELFEKHASIIPNSKGSFKFLHFFIPHAPWRVNENLQFDPHLSGEDGYIKQSRGAVRLVNRIIKILKKMGIYDNSEIVIMSDHGTGSLSPINHNSVYENAMRLVPPCVQSSSLALLLHKQAGSKGKLIVCDTPLELTDLACLLGVRNSGAICHGFNLADSNTKRERKYYYYEWDRDYWSNHFLPPMTEYNVSGHAYDPESYSPGRFIYTEKGIIAVPAHASNAYTLGKEILFSAGGHDEADQYTRAGWSPPEAFQRWTNGPIAGLSFHLENAPRKDLALRLFGFGYLANNKIKCQVVTIIVNQTPIGRWLVNETKWYEAVIPGNLISDKTVNIVFEISNPISPSEIEDSKDIRKLGIAVNKIVMEDNN